ncbi:hypothetical protein BH11BAC7_BH11BAC7_08580 [soil metagenome]
MNLKTFFLSGILFLLICFFSFCSDSPKGGTPVVVADTIVPAAFPGRNVTGIKFPEDTATILGWMTNQYDTASIYNHAWGIWAGLTAQSGQTFQGDSIRIFETWPGIQELQEMVQSGNTQGGCAILKTERNRLEIPNQFGHAAKMNQINNINPIDNNLGFFVSVSYDPTAACFATSTSIFSETALAKYVPASDKIGSIPSFPNTAITLKPVYYLAKIADNLIQVPAWAGPPAVAQDDPTNDWNSFIFADVTNSQPSGKVPLRITQNGISNRDSLKLATINLNDFIYFDLDSSMAAYMSSEQGSQGTTNQFAKGDIAILIAMHVATKEISNWTWQTFFWTPDPANPPFPSSMYAARIRSTVTLKGAAAHYAVATAYAMVLPLQPISGGTNTRVNGIFGYNPYLEAGLGQISNNPPNITNALNSTYKWGVQSNCMSCHALATYIPGNPNEVRYTANQYIDLGDPALYNGFVKLDFAWSIQATLINDLKKSK